MTVILGEADVVEEGVPLPFLPGLVEDPEEGEDEGADAAAVAEAEAPGAEEGEADAEEAEAATAAEAARDAAVEYARMRHTGCTTLDGGAHTVAAASRPSWRASSLAMRDRRTAASCDSASTTRWVVTGDDAGKEAQWALMAVDTEWGSPVAPIVTCTRRCRKATGPRRSTLVSNPSPWRLIASSRAPIHA